MDDRAFVAGYRLGTSLAGVVALNNMRAFVQYRRLLMAHGSWVDAVGLSEELGK